MPVLSPLRVALFADCFWEVNGVALTCRQFAAHAARHSLPFLLVHSGSSDGLVFPNVSDQMILPISPVRLAVERDLWFDLLFARNLRRAQHAVTEFGADLIHVTSPGHMGLLGMAVAGRMGLPVAASWHTNIHEFGAKRLEKMLTPLPSRLSASLAPAAEHGIWSAALQFYRRARFLFAPNPELISRLENGTGRPCYPMARGVDTIAFHPRKRTRTDAGFVIGFVGRLSPEKSVRILADVDSELRKAGITDHRFLIVGDGAERGWLEDRLPAADFPGILQGEALSEAYANMDVFAFPSETDTFGNVIQEALASGVPCIVSTKGGPKFLITHEETGHIADSPQAYARAIASLAASPARLAKMRVSARAAAEGRSWNAVFEGVYARYRDHLSPAKVGLQTKQARFVSPNLH